MHGRMHYIARAGETDNNVESGYCCMLYMSSGLYRSANKTTFYVPVSQVFYLDFSQKVIILIAVYTKLVGSEEVYLRLYKPVQNNSSS